MLRAYRVDAAGVVPELWGMRQDPAGAARWRSYCACVGLLAWVAERDGRPAGLALAVSDPRLLHVHALEGDAEACRLLLRQAIKAAGERDVSGRFRAGRTDLHRLLRLLGFARVAGGGRAAGPSHLFFYWARNRGD
jgi:hypothetical protein